MKKQLIPGILLLAVAVSVLASPQYDEAAKYAGSMKAQGIEVMKDTNPATNIPGYTAKPDESGYYSGTTATSNPDLENAGNSEMHNGEAGKTIMDVIKNRPKDLISTDAPFISGSFDVKDQAETIMQGTDTQCKDVNVNKTQITNYTCERTPAVSLACIRTASVGGHNQSSTEIRTLVIDSGSLSFRQTSGDTLSAVFSVPSGLAGTLVGGVVVNTNPSGYAPAFSLHFLGNTITQKAGTYSLSLTGRLPEGDISLDVGPGSTPSATAKAFNSGYLRFVLTLQVQVQADVFVPDVAWSEKCPFDKSEQVKTGSVCTEPGGDRTFTLYGQQYTLYRDCWGYTDTYVSQSADNGTCDAYMQTPACTVGSTTCLDSLNGTCLREQVVFSCEEKTSGSAQLCGGELVCADGSCDQLDNGKSNGFQSAVSGLAALAAAGKDIAALNGVNVSAFTGEGRSCRKAMAGFSNCCKDSGWGNDVGLASCNTEEKALAEAKKRKLSIYVGSYCAHKVLGVCIEKKEGYCQFESKLAKIIQDQGRRGQLGIGFGRGSSPDCRGLTVAELQRLNFDNINFADFYDDLENGITLPADQVLLDRVKEQIAGQMAGGGL
ncbi:type-F conjugative transfer system mating-pair stabilization protein TraN [Raoultella ornithinolytica]|uniref:type-F conjugative transfer system mating-pair stabilization protein TraN n=1 Tax=Raoultella ornithinolytica TaxID=54291 RepID=UPI00255AC347|nr:type-F conjugative transfer system mating-pair stabilization protein TraN [Raoultella ornithinolytica]MDL4585345.1 type-F conjugative transfer system mating-pair stabilization protein TraN [Raoultella ornithinolytica]MDV1095643.1 type-F conjugative transfer system mating-pair stabilization protein TraN [Raoultella ornithinolytica]MDV1123194.1 type-F conjugative transfer system mating-pair stabilization protein TraN [Raoultella ornithinolytica]MDV1893554.1 type-F conjugative transfer system m